jgi:hypothetical protein
VVSANGRELTGTRKMSEFGKNLKITVDEAHRELTRRVFRDALGCEVKNPGPNLEIYAFANGCGLGAFYVKADEALPEAALKKAPWLEFLVDDPAAAGARLAELGVRPFDYTDKTHSYYCPPGGPVFRLAKRA